MELSAVEFTKSGHNKFGNFKYFELDDIMPCIQRKCYDHDLMMQFLFDEKKATLMIVDVTNGNRFCNSIPMPEVKELNKKMNVVQSLGAYITYLKRYLLLNTFCICEKSVIDSDAMTKMNQKQIQKKMMFLKGKLQEKLHLKMQLILHLKNQLLNQEKCKSKKRCKTLNSLTIKSKMMAMSS